MQFTIDVNDDAKMMGLERTLEQYNTMNPASNKTQA
jgi:hypothetical protein